MEEIGAIQNSILKNPVKVSSTGPGRSKSFRKKELDIAAVINRSERKIQESAKEVKENTNEKMERIAESMDNYVQSVQRDLKIQVHSGTGVIMVKVISEKDGKVIREIPPKEILDLAAKIEKISGLLFNESA